MNRFKIITYYYQYKSTYITDSKLRNLASITNPYNNSEWLPVQFPFLTASDLQKILFNRYKNLYVSHTSNSANFLQTLFSMVLL